MRKPRGKDDDNLTEQALQDAMYAQQVGVVFPWREVEKEQIMKGFPREAKRNLSDDSHFFADVVSLHNRYPVEWILNSTSL